ncbi:unnamed protein product [Caenorhabditis sp. 36 PRJEB53466]|nr:unnamed protein product [Caenorhabditis sp. 36 PRJEB53466]
MALETVQRRRIQKDYDNAAGDNFVNISKSNRLSCEEDPLNMDGIESLTGHPEGRYFGGLIGNKEIVAMSLMAVSLYLINGEHAQTVCTALTSVPPALFSYRVLISSQTSKDGYHSILFYWTLYGLLALIDQFVGTAQGYNLCKGGLLGFVFVHAVRSNWTAVPRSWQFIEEASSPLLTSIFSNYGSDGFIKNNNSSGFVPRTPTMTHFSDDDMEYMLPESSEPVLETMDVNTACSFGPSLAMQSTQNVSPGFVMKTAKLKSPRVENTPSSTLRMRPQQRFETMSAMTMTCGAAADIVTVPSEHITFSEDSREAMIRVTNVSPLHIMFALKTNADAYLIAAPTTGILFSGQTMVMRVGVTDNYFDDFSDPGVSIDKLAIDYASIPPSLSSLVTKFSPQVFQSQNRRRHAIRVFYQ